MPDFSHQLEVPLKEPTRLSEVLANLGIPIAEVYLAVVNGEMVDPHIVMVTQTDDVKLYPPVDGG
ncbi:MAG: MoaD/ThiS family protein [Anaerolineales bacterium]